MSDPAEYPRDPAYLSIPPSAVTMGDDRAAGLMRLCGVEMMPWQAEFLRLVMARRADGLWACREVGLVVPRQNGKSWALAAVALHGLFVDDLPLQVWSAHEFRTAQESYRLMESLVNASPALRRRVKAMYKSNGNNLIETRGGCRLLFVARTRGATRGLSVDRLLLDEAMQLSGDAVAAMLPTQAARPNPQIMYAASAGLIDTDHLRTVRDRGRAGGDPKLGWVEYCMLPGDDGEVDLDDRAEWYRANPSLGVGSLSEDDVETERLSMDPTAFGRERGGLWTDPVGDEGPERPFEPEAWAALGAGPVPAERGRVWVAVDVGPDAAYASLAAAFAVPGGVWVSLVDRRPGTAWVARAVDDLAARWDAEECVIDGIGAAGALARDLAERLDVPLRILTTREVIDACLTLQRAVTEQTVHHSGDPVLQDAVVGARPRRVGDTGWAWRRSDSADDITALVAVTWAHWAVASDAEAVADMTPEQDDEDELMELLDRRGTEFG